MVCSSVMPSETTSGVTEFLTQLHGFGIANSAELIVTVPHLTLFGTL